MKSFIIAMSIFAVLVISGIVFNFCLNGTSENLLKSCEEISDDIKNEQMQEAYDKSKELSEYIDGKKPLLSSILDHSNIDEIEKQISELMGFTEQNDVTDAVVSVKKLKHMFEHLPENYGVKFQNIL